MFRNLLQCQFRVNFSGQIHAFNIFPYTYFCCIFIYYPGLSRITVHFQFFENRASKKSRLKISREIFNAKAKKIGKILKLSVDFFTAQRYHVYL